MGSFLIQMSGIAREVLGRAGNPDVTAWTPEQLQALLVDPLRTEGAEVASAMAAWLAGGPDLATRFRSEEWEEFIGEPIWSGRTDD